MEEIRQHLEKVKERLALACAALPNGGNDLRPAAIALLSASAAVTNAMKAVRAELGGAPIADLEREPGSDG